VDVRARLIALLVAVLCAVGWVPVERARGTGDGVRAADGLGVLPGRRQSVAQDELDLADDDPVCASVVDEPERIAAQSIVVVDRSWVEPCFARFHGPARVRGPPSIA
jgi:lauroyl/myristoyl acyltransferase